jgi:hypothetical protein
MEMTGRRNDQGEQSHGKVADARSATTTPTNIEMIPKEPATTS